MQQPPLQKAGILAVAITLIAISSWEIYLRSTGEPVSYDDGKELWADKRARVYAPQERATVFVGSSRNKYDIDIATWQSLTNDEVVQLSLEGTSPMPVLNEIANDEDFRGKVIIDVTETLFFSIAPFAFKTAQECIDYYKKRTPAERASFAINRQLESRFVFLDKFGLSLNALLDNIPLHDRPGVFSMPTPFPKDFQRVNFGRQDIMTKRFEEDTLLQNRVKNIWKFYGQVDRGPAPTEWMIDSLMNNVRSSIDRIKARGGRVLFLRTPASGPLRQIEEQLFPRARYWERLLNLTDCPGIHFADYPGLANFVCPEFSHLKREDAVVFTSRLIDILQKEKGWVFPYKPLK